MKDYRNQQVSRSVRVLFDLDLDRGCVSVKETEGVCDANCLESESAKAVKWRARTEAAGVQGSACAEQAQKQATQSAQAAFVARLAETVLLLVQVQVQVRRQQKTEAQTQRPTQTLRPTRWDLLTAIVRVSVCQFVKTR